MNARIRVMASAIILAAVALCVCIQAVAPNDTGEAGNAYVTGYTYSRDFPAQNPLRVDCSGGIDAFVVELNSTGLALIYSTYLGRSGEDSLHSGRIQRIYSLVEGFREHYQRLAKEFGQQARS